MNRIFLKSKNISLPLQVEWELTYKCNLNCLHCYISGNYKKATKQELKLDEIKKILDKLVKIGTLWIHFIGGEPLLRKDFPFIIEAAYNRGFLIAISTNCTLLNDKMVSIFKKYPPIIIDLTIYGSSAKTHDSFTGVKGSFNKLLQNIPKLKKIGKLPIVLLKTTINKHNKNEIQDIKKIAKQLKIPLRYNYYVCPKLDGFLRDDLRLSPEEYVKIELSNKKIITKLKNRFMAKQTRYNFNGEYNACGIGKTILTIDPYGFIRPCTNIRKPKIHAFENEDFLLIWEKMIKKTQKTLLYTKSDCKNCKLSSLCFNCPARSFTETGKTSYPVDYFCKIAKLRYEIIKK